MAPMTKVMVPTAKAPVATELMIDTTATAIARPAAETAAHLVDQFPPLVRAVFLVEGMQQVAHGGQEIADVLE